MNEETKLNKATTTWQQILEQGKANEALCEYVSGNEPTKEAIEVSLENLVRIQETLREKNPSKAQTYVKEATTNAYLVELFQVLQRELQTLETATKALENHDADKTLELLTNVQHSLLRAEVETLRGTALIYYDKTLEAKQSFDIALELDPGHYRAITNLGNLALEADKIDEAIVYYEKALKLNEDFANAHHNLAVAYRKKGMVGKSVGALKKAQRVSQQKLREEARGMLKNSQTAKYVRWVMIGAAILLVLFVLRQRTP
ncbi:MAG: tetratricopeptide repeat protein [Trueperaceae bacterium]